MAHLGHWCDYIIKRKITKKEEKDANKNKRENIAIQQTKHSYDIYG